MRLDPFRKREENSINDMPRLANAFIDYFWKDHTPIIYSDGLKFGVCAFYGVLYDEGEIKYIPIFKEIHSSLSSKFGYFGKRTITSEPPYPDNSVWPLCIRNAKMKYIFQQAVKQWKQHNNI